MHRRLHQSETASRVDVAGLVRDLVADMIGASGRTDIRVALDLAPVLVLAEKSVALALLFNEIVTNILKHAFPAGRPGTIAIRVGLEEDLRVVVEDDGVGMPPADEPKGSFGQALMRTLARQLGARLAVESGPRSGTRVVVTMPASVVLPAPVDAPAG